MKPARPLLLFVMAVLFFNAATAQNKSITSPYMLAMQITIANVYEASPVIGYAQQPSQQQQRLQLLVAHATDDVLIDLATNHTNAVVRLYAFQALRLKKVEVPQTLSKKFGADNTKVVVVNGCVFNESTVSEVLKKYIEITPVRQLAAGTPAFF